MRGAAGRMILRYCTFLVGIIIMSFGVALSVQALIGTTPISAIPLVMSLATPFTLGQYTVAINVVLFIGQILILRRQFEKIQILQIPAAFAFGGACDLALWILRDVQPTSYPAQLATSILGSIVLGIGVWLQVSPKVLTLAGDGFIVAIAKVTKRLFGQVKIIVDSTLVAIAIVLSLVLLGGLEGVREGTVIAAFLVGYVVKLLQRKIPWPAALSPMQPPR